MLLPDGKVLQSTTTVPLVLKKVAYERITLFATYATEFTLIYSMGI